MNNTNRFRTHLVAALRTAALEILSVTRNEHLYAFSIYTSGEEDYSYVCASANTEEGLRERAERYAEKYPDYAGETGLKALRWSVPDWRYHDFSVEVRSLEVPPGEGDKRDRDIYKTFIRSLKTVRQDKILTGLSHVTMLVTCGDISEEFFFNGLKQLNSADVVNRYLEEFTPLPYLNWLRSLPASGRSEMLISLYRDLSLGISSDLALNARARNVDEHDLRPLFYKLGEIVVSGILDLVEQFGFGAIFNEVGSPAYGRHGAFTSEARLATSSIFLLADCSMSEEHIHRLQDLLRRRVELDEGLSQTTTLAENIARLLHNLRPGRFPDSQLNPATNHLDNPGPFLRK